MSPAEAPSRESAVRPPRRRRWLVVAAAGALALWCAIDLYGPRRVDLRAFDADQVARLDTAMWRSYYERKPLLLFFQLAELMRKQFHFPLLRSHVVALSAARAAFLFKDGHDRRGYERALPDLVRYYQAIRNVSTTPFDVRRTADLELEWWIVHRERAGRPGRQLARALAEAAAALYRLPAAKLMEYGRYRAQAMSLRDRQAAARGVTAEGWASIERDLRTSWRSLWKATRAS